MLYNKTLWNDSERWILNHMKKKLIALLFAAVFAFALCGCGEEPVATVNGEEISQAAYGEYVSYELAQMEYMYSSYGMSFTLDEAMSESVKTQAIQELIYMEELKQACAKEDCLPSDKEIDEYVYQMLGVTSESEYKESIATIKSSYGLGEDTLRTVLCSDLYSEKLGEFLLDKNGIDVSDDEVKAKYEEAPENYDTRTVSHILVSPEVADGREAETDESGNTVYTDEEWAAAEAEAKDLIKQLDEGADFAKLAKENSDDTGSAENGGALGDAFTAAESSYVQEFTDASFALKAVDEYTKEPVKSSYGYHIILCTGIQDADHDFDQLTEKIKSDLLEDQEQTLVSEYMQKFEEESEIVINFGENAGKEEDEAAADNGDAEEAAEESDSADAAADEEAAEGSSEATE